MKKIVVLGTGLVGSLIVRDLASDAGLTVVAVDRSERNLNSLATLAGVDTIRADLSDPLSIAAAIADADAVVGAVPGRIGFEMLKAVIEQGKPVADISFSPEDLLELDELARKNGVTAVVDCGVSPGLSNLVIGRAAAMLDEVEDVRIYVGGLPVERRWPFEYTIVFSATDVIEEYLRPARLVENGVVVTRPALSEVELIDFPHVGTVEAFNTDGLRSLLRTVPGRNMSEKTMRYPGHAEKMRMLRETGFFSDEPMTLGNGTTVVPRELSERLLFQAWKRPLDSEEITLMRVVVKGTSEGVPRTFTFDLLDRTDPETGTTSMARTTGFPCAIMARLLASGGYNAPGVQPPENFGGDSKIYSHVIRALSARSVHLVESES